MGEGAGSAPRWGPSRTLLAANVGLLRFGLQRLYPHRGPRLATEEHKVVNEGKVGLKTTETAEAS